MNQFTILDTICSDAGGVFFFSSYYWLFSHPVIIGFIADSCESFSRSDALCLKASFRHLHHSY